MTVRGSNKLVGLGRAEFGIAPNQPRLSENLKVDIHLAIERCLTSSQCTTYEVVDN